jgi:argininosuccinate lyase
MKLWAGRLDGQIDSRVNDLNASIAFDCRMARQDIIGSMAHAAMLGKVGVISAQDAKQIADGLAGILADLQSGKLQIDMTAEDIHTFVEGELTARIGQAGKRLHTARSRNDQVALDIRLYLSDAQEKLIDQIKTLALALCDIASEHLTTVMPGYTHLQRAQPVTLAHHLMAYVQMLLRDMDRLEDCQKRTRISPLGSGALAGTTYPLDRGDVAAQLGFYGVTENSMDGVSDRDFVLELASCLSILMVHLSRLSEELILWCSWEFKFVTLSDSFSTGSSIMPQKKNPDVPELVRGKAGRVFGHTMALLTTMKGLPLAYNKDMQEDKEAIFDILDTVTLCLEVFTPMIRGAVFHKQNMVAAAAAGFINATDCADYLVGKGMPFRDAYQISGQIVAWCVQNGKTLETMPLENYQQFSPLFDSDVYEAIDLVRCVSLRRVYGGPAPEAVRVQIDHALEKLK